MRRSRILTVLAAMCALPSTAFAAPPSSPLVCHGGSGMRIVIQHEVNSAGVPEATVMSIFFKPGPVAAAVRNPGPGECAWRDRTLGPGDPAVLWIKSPKVEFAFQMMGDGRIVADSRGPLLFVEGTRRSAEARDWQYLVEGVLRGQIFTVYVYNDGKVLAVTPFKP